jgi:hypothetical protein
MSERDRHLAPCPVCHRHVRADEAVCPFCVAPLPVRTGDAPRALPRGRLSRAALMAAGAGATLIGACSNTTTMPPYGLPPIPDSGWTSDAADASSDGAGGGAAGRGGAGGADTGSGAGGAGSVAPHYGAPAPRDGG